MTCPTCKKEPRFGCPECRRRAKPPSITTEQARELMKEGAKLQGALKPRIEKMQRPVDLETEYFQAKEEWKARALAAEQRAQEATARAERAEAAERENRRLVNALRDLERVEKASGR